MKLEYHHQGDQMIFMNYFPRRDNEFLYVTIAGYTHPNPSYRIERKNSYVPVMYVLEYVTEGKGHIVYDGKQYTVEKGDFYMVNTTHPHDYYADSENPFAKVWINVYGTFMDHLTEALNFEPITICRVDVSENFKDIHNFLKWKSAYEVLEMTEQVAIKLFGLLYRVHTGMRVSQIHSNRYLQVSNYIKMHITDGININCVCTDNYISKSTLYRLFREELGISPNAYIKNLKVGVAATILKTTNLEIPEIMRQLGFYDYSHFSRIFASVKGCSPVAYRKKHRNEK